jgi:hypothetical protein
MADEDELKFYRTLASFSSKSSKSFSESKTQATNLYNIVKKFVATCRSQGLQVPVDLLNLMVLTINSTLHHDQQLMNPQITDYTLHVIYSTLKLLHDNNIKLWNKINSSVFNQKHTRIFLFPGLPRKNTWKFVFGEFAFLDQTVPKHSVPLEYVQHVVHDINDVLSILQTMSGKAHFKGSHNEDFTGHPLFWLAPLPPPKINQSTIPCDSLDPTASRYGCFRFSIPFKILIQRFPTCFTLGTRKYNQEHSHTILLTNPLVRYIRLIGKREPTELKDIVFIKTSFQMGKKEIINDTSFKWLCFHDDPWTKWDQLEFAIATKELQFDPIDDDIRLDFIDHDCKICVSSLKTSKTCKYSWNKTSAMKNFLTKLNEKHIELDTFFNFFTDNVWNELLDVKQSLSSKRLRT